MLYVKSEITGSSSNSLEAISGSGLYSEDRALVMTSEEVFFYRLAVDDYSDHNPPNVVKPLTQSAGKRWHLVSRMSDVVYDNVLVGNALSFDPPDPPPGGGGYVIWQSNGTGLGDDGDIMIKITNTDNEVKVYTLVDFSEI